MTGGFYMIIINLSKLEQSLYQSPINISLNIRQGNELKYKVAYITSEMFSYLNNKYEELKKENQKLYIKIEDELYEFFIVEMNESEIINEQGIKNIKTNESISLIKVKEVNSNYKYKILEGKYL
jgi:hypothetical protein